MTEILGTPTSLSMRVSRKLSDSNYGSFEVSAELEVSLAKDVNLEDSFQSLRAWLEANVGKTIKAQKAAYDQLQPAEGLLPHERIHQYDDQMEYGIGDHRATPPPGALKADGQAPVTAPQATSTQSSGQMVTEVWQNPSLAVKRDSRDQKYLIVKGGKWQKFGAPAWPEVIPFTYFTDWPVGETYNLPDGLTEAVVQMNDKGQPKKVIEFR